MYVTSFSHFKEKSIPLDAKKDAMLQKAFRKNVLKI